MNTGLMNYNQTEQAMTVEQIKANVNLIQQVMAGVMQNGQHYGKIPGCGDKPTLLKPGAEKLCMTFRLRPILDSKKDIEVIDLPMSANGIVGHREYRVTVHIVTMDGTEIATGIGVCSTMEGKFRYRSESTGRDVPGEYWAHRDQDMLGGPSFTPRKVAGKWVIFQRVEHDNPADYYNTCEKMAKKRALVDGTLSATAASDMFTQDVEDMPEVIQAEVTEATITTAPQQEQPAPRPNGNGSHVSEPQVKRLIAIAMKNGYTVQDIDDYIAGKYALNSKNEIEKGNQYDAIVSFFEKKKINA